MTIEYTFSIIKPDATERNLIGKVNTYLEEAGLQIVAQKMIKMTSEQAKEFYAEHSERPFFNGLVEIMTAAPVVVQVLKGEGAIMKNREIMGATNPAEAAPGTIRKDIGQSIDANTVHGSDSPESAVREISLFFNKEEIFG